MHAVIMRVGRSTTCVKEYINSTGNEFNFKQILIRCTIKTVA